jgi:hypothetical protein
MRDSVNDAVCAIDATSVSALIKVASSVLRELLKMDLP